MSKYKISLTIVGTGNQEMEEYSFLVDLIHKFNLEKCVTLVLNVPHNEMNNVYSCHDLYVLPSSKDAYAYSVIEAMSNGLPVIASDKNGSSDCIVDGLNGYIFKSNNLDSLVEKIELVIKNAESLERMADQSLRLCKDSLNLDVYHDRLVNMIRNEFNIAQN